MKTRWAQHEIKDDVRNEAVRKITEWCNSHCRVCGELLIKPLDIYAEYPADDLAIKLCSAQCVEKWLKVHPDGSEEGNGSMGDAVKGYLKGG